MSPLLKNVLLAFAAGAITSLSVALEAGVEPSKAAIAAVVGGAIYAGARAAVGTIKEALTGTPFKVDTEAPVGE